MEGIRSWWEVPCVAHFCHIFKKPFKLPTFEIEEFEDALLLDYFPSPSKLLVEIFCRFLDGIIDTDITEDNWPLMLKLHLKWRCDNLKEKWNPLSGEKEYKDLDVYSRVSIMHKLCHWRLELDDIGDLLRGIDGPSLRLSPVGRDMDGNTYWHFYGTRLYKEEAKKKKKKKDASEEVTPAKHKGKEVSVGRRRGPQNKANTLSSQRGRSKQVIQENATPKGRRNARKKNHEVEGEGEEASNDGENEVADGSVSEGGDGGKEERQDNAEEDEDNSSEKKANSEVSNEASNGAPSNLVVAESGWTVACTAVDEWNEVIDSFEGTKHNETKKLLRNLQEILPEVEYIYNVRQKQLKKRALEELPRRSSDRIAIKAAIREEEDRLEALEREMRREELRKLEAEEVRVKEEEADLKRQKRMEEALQRRKAREQQQVKQRMEEDDNWEKAMSGELKGRRKAAIGAAENVSEVQMAENFLLTDKDFDLYTAMHKILAGLRKHEEAWVFEDPVTEAIAPGYFEVVDKPMDYGTVEKKVEEQTYKDKEEFIADVELVYTNCCDYNGEESEYFELAEDIRKLFHTLVGVHFEGKSEEVPEGTAKKGQRRGSRSPSACKTPELTSESSSEEGSDEDESDESYVEGGEHRPKKSKGKGGGSMLKLTPSLEQRLGSGFLPPRMPHPHHMMPPHGPPPPPHMYQHFMQQYLQHRMPRPPHMLGPPDMYPPGAPYPPRLPPPYPGFSPDHTSLPRPPPGAMYRHPYENQGMSGPPPDMMPPRPMYPPAHAYPPPHPSHPAHPAHPHHAAYRQHMFYEMQYHGMDPRMTGMRPGMRPGMGMSPRPPFPDTHPLHSTSEHKHKSLEEIKVASSSEEGIKKEVGEKKEGRKEEGRGEKELGEAVGVEEAVGEKELGEKMEQEEEDGGEEQMDREQEKELSGEESERVKEALPKERIEEKVAQGEPGILAQKEEDKANKDEDKKPALKVSTTSIGSMEEKKGSPTPEQIEKYRYFQHHQHMMALQQRREAIARGYPFPPHPPAHPDEAAAAAYYGHQYGGFPPSNFHPADPRQMEASHQYWMEMEARRRQYAMMKQAQHAQAARKQQREGGSKERSAETGQEGLEDVPDYQESLRKYALGLGEQGAYVPPHSREQGGHLPPHSRPHSREQGANLPSHSREQGGHLPPHSREQPPHSREQGANLPSHSREQGTNLPSHSREEGVNLPPHRELGTNLPPHSREQGTNLPPHSREQGVNLPPHSREQGVNLPPHSSELGVNLPHSSEQGVNLPHSSDQGVNLPPHSSEQGVNLPHSSDQGVNLPPHSREEGANLPPHSREEGANLPPHSRKGGCTTNETPPSQGSLREKHMERKVSHSSPHMYPGMPMPNGYPPYPMPPYHTAPHHHFPGDRRNGAGYPPDAYYSPHAMPYRMPPYLPYPNMPKSDELWLKQSATEDTTQSVATPPAAKRPCPSS